MANKGEKVLRMGRRRSQYWYNEDYHGENPDYEIVCSTDKKGSTAQHIQVGVMVGIRKSGWWGFLISGWMLCLRGNNTVALIYTSQDIFGTLIQERQSASFAWNAGIKYRMRLQATNSDNILTIKGWVWADGSGFPSGSPLINYSMETSWKMKGWLGIHSGVPPFDLCERVYIYDDIIHNLDGFVGIHKPIPSMHGFQLLYGRDGWRTRPEYMFLEVAYKGTRKNNGYVFYKPNLINVNKQLSEFQTIGSTNFTEYWTGESAKLPPDDFVDHINADFYLQRLDNLGAKHGIALSTLPTNTTHKSGIYKLAGKKLNCDILASFVNEDGRGGALFFRMDESTEQYTGYSIYRHSSTSTILSKHNNSNAGTQLASWENIHLPSGTQTLFFLRVNIEGNRIRAKSWHEFASEPDDWQIDIIDNSPIMNEGWLGVGSQRATASMTTAFVTGLAWAPSDQKAFFPTNTLTKWQTDINRYGDIVMEFGVSDSPNVAPPEENILKTNNWGIIPCINWHRGTNGISKYLFPRLNFKRGSCPELSPVGGNEVDLIIEGDLCSTLIDDNVVKRYRNKILWIQISNLYAPVTYFSHLGYYIKVIESRYVELSEMLEFDLIIVGEYSSGDNTFFAKIKYVLDVGIPVIILTAQITDGLLKYLNIANPTSMGGTGTTPVVIMQQGKVGVYSELTEPFPVGYGLPALYPTNISVHEQYAGVPLILNPRPVGIPHIHALALDKGALDLIGEPLGARLVYFGFMSASNYSGSDWTAEHTQLLDNAIRWCTKQQEDIYGSVKIIVKDVNANPLSGVKVLLNNTRIMYTDLNGEVVYQNVLPATNITAYLEKPGYSSLYTSAFSVTVNQQTVVNVTMHILSIEYIDFSYYFEADSGVTLNGSNVVSWSCKRNKTIAIQEQESLQPQYQTSQINGYPAIYFAGGANGKYMDFDIPLTNNYTVVFVAKRDGTGSRCILGLGDNALMASATTNWGLRGSTTRLSSQAISNYRICVATLNNIDGYHLLFRTDGDILDYSILSLGSLTTGSPMIARSDITNNFRLGGHIVAILAADRILSEDELHIIQTYLSNKYNLPYNPLKRLHTINIDFTEYEVKSGLPFNPNNWVSFQAGQDARASIVESGGSKQMQLDYTGITSGIPLYYLAGYAPEHSGKMRWKFKVDTVNTNTRAYFPFRIFGGVGCMIVSVSQSVLSVLRMPQSSASTQSSITIPTIDADTYYYLLLEYSKIDNHPFNGIIYRIKLWKASDIEPENWTLEDSFGTTDIRPIGVIGVGGRGCVVTFDEIIGFE